MNYTIPESAERVGAIHTHGAEDPAYDSYNFSDTDKTGAERNSQNEYIVTPAGQIVEYDVEIKGTKNP